MSIILLYNFFFETSLALINICRLMLKLHAEIYMDPHVNCSTSEKTGMCWEILVHPFNNSLYENPFSGSWAAKYREIHVNTCKANRYICATFHW